MVGEAESVLKITYTFDDMVRILAQDAVTKLGKPGIVYDPNTRTQIEVEKGTGKVISFFVHVEIGEGRK